MSQAIAVFCGSSAGHDPAHARDAKLLGEEIAKSGHALVYGGSKDGLMGAVANGTLEAGGHVTGVLPRFLQKREVAHTGISELILCESMHERKKTFFEKSHAFVALPGGLGTLEELIEILTWKQLGLHRYPVALYSPKGFYDPLLATLERMSDEGFLYQFSKEDLIIERTIPNLIEKLNARI